MSLLIPFGVLLAVLAVVLAVVAIRQGERRAKVALALAIAATAFGVLFPLFVASQLADF